MSEKGKINRDYQLVMNRVEKGKDKGKEGEGKEWGVRKEDEQQEHGNDERCG